MIKTAGRVIQEEELRAFFKCSEFLHLGGREPLEFLGRVCQGTLEEVLSRQLRDQGWDPFRDLAPIALRHLSEQNQAEHLMESQLQRQYHWVMLWMRAFFELFPMRHYLVVYGPLRPRVVVSKTPIDLQIPGILRSRKRQTLHVLSMCPYRNEHDMLTDVPSYLKLKLVQPLLEPHHRRAQAEVHLLAAGRNGYLTHRRYDTDEVSLDYLTRIQRAVRLMEHDYHFPLVPCHNDCPYKKICHPRKS